MVGNLNSAVIYHGKVEKVEKVGTVVLWYFYNIGTRIFFSKLPNFQKVAKFSKSSQIFKKCQSLFVKPHP
jgi:hypothetical protein